MQKVPGRMNGGLGRLREKSVANEPHVPSYPCSGDGSVNSDDFNLLAGQFGQALAPSDPLLTHPTLDSTHRAHGGVLDGTPVCEFGHQGLMHDETLGLVFNRARVLHPMLGRFMQRDPLGYVDGLSLYEAVLSNPIRSLDQFGERSSDSETSSLTCS